MTTVPGTFHYPSHWPRHETVHSPDCEACHLEAEWQEQFEDCDCLEELWEREDVGTPAVPEIVWVCSGCLRVTGPSWAGGMP